MRRLILISVSVGTGARGAYKDVSETKPPRLEYVQCLFPPTYSTPSEYGVLTILFYILTVDTVCPKSVNHIA